MKTAPLSLFIYLLVSFSCLAFQSGPSQVLTQQFTDENGLPQNSVTGLAFDNMGFIWITTQGGLVRFDGQKMVIFNKTKLTVDSDRFVALKTDGRTGTLYALNDLRQLVLLKDGNVAKPQYSSLIAFDLAAVNPSQLPRMTSGVTMDTSTTKSDFSRYILIPGAGGKYYLYSNQRITFFNAGRVTGTLPFPGEPCYELFPHEPHMRKALVERNKKVVFADNFMSIGGALFYHQGAEGPALLKVSESGITKMLLTGDILENVIFKAGNGGIQIFTNRSTRQAFAHLAGSIYQIIYNEKRQALDTRLLVEGYDVVENLVSRILYDEGNRVLFLGSFSQGLGMVRRKMFHVVTNAKDKDFHNVYYAQLPYSKSSVIIPEGTILGDYKASAQEGMAFRSKETTLRWSMLKDRTGHFWMAKQNRLFQLTPDGARQKASWEFDREPKVIYQGIDGNIWIGFKTGELAALNPDPKHTDKPTQRAKVEGMILFLHQDKPGRIWIGTSRGLFLYDSLKDALYPVNGLARKQIRSIYSTAAGELWITTYGDGLFGLSGNKLVKMPLDRNGYLSHAHCIVEDSLNNFWISTNKGLFRASKADMISYAKGKTDYVFYRYFSKADGFATNEFNGGCQPCAIKLEDGNYSFPSMNGLVWFKPEQIPYPDLSAKFILENLRVDNQPVAMADTLQLPYDFKHVAFDIASPYTGLSNNLDFHYLVQNNASAPKEWSRVTKDQKINVYSLKSGTYTLVVRKTLGFQHRFVEKRLVLRICNPWFFSWWFFVLVLSALALIFWLLTKWRTHSLNVRNQILSQKVEERTQNLSKALNDLKTSDQALQTQLQIQMRIIGVINHDVHSPLRYLNKHVPQFLELIGPYLPDHDVARLGNAIGKSTQNVYSLVDDLLQFIKTTYNRKGQIVYEQIAVTEILEKKAQFFYDMAHENQTMISVRSSPLLTINTNRVMLEIMIHNLTDNAVKHTISGAITLSAFETQENKTGVVVEDTGFGMYPEIIDWLNNSSTTNSMEPGVGIPVNMGLGLIMVKEIARLLGVQIEASANSEGTFIRLLFNE